MSPTFSYQTHPCYWIPDSAMQFQIQHIHLDIHRNLKYIRNKSEKKTNFFNIYVPPWGTYMLRDIYVISLNIYMSLNITYKGLYLILLDGNTICPDFSPKLYNPPWFFFLMPTWNLKPSLISSISKHLLNERNYNTLKYPHSLRTAISYLIIIRSLCLFVPLQGQLQLIVLVKDVLSSLMLAKLVPHFPWLVSLTPPAQTDLPLTFNSRQSLIYNLCILAYSQRKIQ